MKSLSLQRPLLLMIIGLPGSGKSYFASRFTDMFGAPIIQADFIRRHLSDTPTYGRHEELTIAAFIRKQTENLLKTSMTFVIDGGLNVRTERHQLQKMAHTNGYDTLIVWVQTDEPTSRNRATKRHTKLSDDYHSQPLTEQQFTVLSRRLTPPLAHEPYTVISGKHTFAAQAKVILKKLVVPRQEQLYKPGAYSSQAYDQPIIQLPSPPRRRNININ